MKILNTLQALLNDRMERSSQIEAVTGGGVSYTFEEYAKRIDQLAHYLYQKGIRKRRPRLLYLSKPSSLFNDYAGSHQSRCSRSSA